MGINGLHICGLLVGDHDISGTYSHLIPENGATIYLRNSGDCWLYLEKYGLQVSDGYSYAFSREHGGTVQDWAWCPQDKHDESMMSRICAVYDKACFLTSPRPPTVRGTELSHKLYVNTNAKKIKFC